MRHAIYHSWRRQLMLLPMLLVSALPACSPHYNWRQVHDDDAHFSVLLPAKPASLTRHIELDGMPLEMRMTAAEVDHITFAVGSAVLVDGASAPAALQAIRSALLKNIGGTLQAIPLPDGPSNPDNASDSSVVIDIVANGNVRGQPLYLMARLQAKGQRVYQAVIISPGKAIATEQAEMLFSSFKLD